MHAVQTAQTLLNPGKVFSMRNKTPSTDLDNILPNTTAGPEMYTQVYVMPLKKILSTQRGHNCLEQTEMFFLLPGYVFPTSFSCSFSLYICRYLQAELKTFKIKLSLPRTWGWAYGLLGTEFATNLPGGCYHIPPQLSEPSLLPQAFPQKPIDCH